MLAPHGEVIGTDSGTPDVPGEFEARLGVDGVELLERAACVVKSPGVPNEAPVIVPRASGGCPVLGELELAWRLLPNRFVAVTGTNGKTTTTELLGAIWREAACRSRWPATWARRSRRSWARWTTDATVVCEVSSFQAEDSEAFAPDRAVLLNVTEDHLDRHGTLRGLPRREAAHVREPDAGAGGGRATGVEVPGSARAHRVRGAAAAGRGDPPARRAQPRERRWPRQRPRSRRVCREEAVAAALRSFRRRAAPARGGGLGGWRALRERLEGHERLVGGARDRGVRRRRARDPRRQPQGRRLRGPAGRRSRRAAWRPT